MRTATVAVVAAAAWMVLVPAAAQDVAAPGPCSLGSVRLASYYYVVDGVRHEQLDGQVGTGDLFTIVVRLQTCGAPDHDVAMQFEMPPCQTMGGDARPGWVEDLNSDNVTDDAEGALVRDLRAALSCDPVMPQAFASAAIVSLTLASIGVLVAVSAVRRRRG